MSFLFLVDFGAGVSAQYQGLIAVAEGIDANAFAFNDVFDGCKRLCVSVRGAFWRLLGFRLSQGMADTRFCHLVPSLPTPDS